MYSQLVEINAEMFEEMDNLEKLYLGANKLTSVPLNAFMKLTKLKYIQLGYNQIEELPNGLLKNNVNLETIGLYQNKLKFIGSTLFDGLTKLDYVDLESNVCINKEYTGSTTITKMKKDIKAQCFKPIIIWSRKLDTFIRKLLLGLTISFGLKHCVLMSFFIWVIAVLPLYLLLIQTLSSKST